MNVKPTGSAPFAALRAQLAQKIRATRRASTTPQAAGVAPPAAGASLRAAAAGQGATAPSPLGAGAISALAGAGAGALAPPITSQPPLTVDGLLQAWGQRDARYDFDHDGTVNMRDLLILLARQSEQAEEPAPTEPGLGPAPKEPDSGAPAAPVAGTDAAAPPDSGLVPAPAPAVPTVDGLLAAWGSADTTYDLDSSGTVDMADLLALLSRIGSAQAESHDAPTTPPPHEGAPGIDAAPALASDGASSSATPGVDGLLEAWGERGSQYDLDGNGAVNMRDLLLMLSRLAGRDAERSERPSSPPGPGAGAGPFTSSKALLDRLAARAARAGGLGIDIRG
jgi:hypothetical protein